MAKKKITWETLKSGAMKGSTGWFASHYPSGWYFVYSDTTGNYNPTEKFTGEFKQMGPYKSFELGLIEWEKKQ